MSELKQLEMQKDDEMEIDLGEIFHLLMNKLWIIVLCFIIGATLAFGGTKLLITPKYSASSMIYILTKTTSVTSLADIQMGTQLTADFEILATSRPVLEEVIEKLNLDYTYEELKSMIQTDNQTDTRILRFTVLDANAKEAKKIANELADVTAERVAYVMSSDKPKVVEEAVVPKYPSSPNTKKNTAMGGLAFAFVAATVIVLRYLMNDTIQTEEDIKKFVENIFHKYYIENEKNHDTVHVLSVHTSKDDAVAEWIKRDDLELQKQMTSMQSFSKGVK